MTLEEISVHLSKSNFAFVPLLDFNEIWTDQRLYTYYELTDNEQKLIEGTMRPINIDESKS